MYQFGMLRTPFSVCTGAIDRNPLPLPEGKKSQCFHTVLVKKGVIMGYNTQIQCVSSLGDASMTSGPQSPDPLA